MNDSVQNSTSKFESAFNSGDKNKIAQAYDEVFALRNDSEFTASFNQSLSDKQSDIPMLQGFQLTGFDDEGDMQFSNSSGQTIEMKKNGAVNKSADTSKYSNTKNSDSNSEDKDKSEEKLKVKVDAEGKGTHEVEKGDTIWGMAERICRERNGGKKPTDAEIAKEMNAIIKENPQIKDPNKIKEGRDVIKLPEQSVKDLQKIRNEKQETTTVSENGKVKEITYPDGSSVKVDRDEKGVTRVTERNKDGEETVYEKGPDGKWQVKGPGEKEFKPYPGNIEVSDNGTVKKSASGETSTKYPNGTVRIENSQKGTETIIAADGTIYEKTGDKWTKKGPKDAQPQEVKGDVKVDENGKVRERTPEQARIEHLGQKDWLLKLGPEGKSVFNAIDADGDGYLTKEEIKKYREAHKPGGKGDDPQQLTREQDDYLKELEEKTDKVEEANDDEWFDENDGITRGDLENWTQEELKKLREKKNQPAPQSSNEPLPRVEKIPGD